MKQIKIKQKDARKYVAKHMIGHGAYYDQETKQVMVPLKLNNDRVILVRAFKI